MLNVTVSKMYAKGRFTLSVGFQFRLGMSPLSKMFSYVIIEVLEQCVPLKHGCITWRKAELSFLTLHVLRHRLLSVILTYLLTPWSNVILEKLIGFQLAKKFPAFYGTRRFIAALTSARHLSLSWANSIQSILPHPTSWRSIFILSSHLHLGLSSGLFPSDFPTKTLYTPYAPHYVVFSTLLLPHPS